MKRNGKSGMTLIETIVAFAIIAVIVVVAISGINTIASVNVKSQDTNRADEEIETRIAQASLSDDGTTLGEVRIALPAGEGGELVELRGVMREYTENDKSLTIFLPDE